MQRNQGGGPELHTVAIIVGAGRGTRLGGPIPKQYEKLGAYTLFQRSICAFLANPRISAVLPVISADAEELFAKLGLADSRLMTPIAGGRDRQESVYLGLKALKNAAPERVLIHDAARPFVSQSLIERVLAGPAYAGIVPARRVTDTLKQTADNEVLRTQDRETLVSVQTPQGFPYGALLAAHERAERGMTDDAAVMEAAGEPVSWVEGEIENVKITTPDDLAQARRSYDAGLQDIRTGQGYDVHAFADGSSLWLCGVEIDHSRTLSGHSDADVALHALTDAILGALADGDIGHHFPPSDPRWKGARSDQFLRFACERLTERGGTLRFADITMVCEEPKIGPHRDAMRAAVAGILDAPVNRVSVKATTSESLGFTGRREGIAALATATIALPL